MCYLFIIYHFQGYISEIRDDLTSERGNVGTDHTAQNLSLGNISGEVCCIENGATSSIFSTKSATPSVILSSLKLFLIATPKEISSHTNTIFDSFYLVQNKTESRAAELADDPINLLRALSVLLRKDSPQVTSIY